MAWYLIFERNTSANSPGAATVSSPAGAGMTRKPDYRSFKPLMILEAQNAKTALYNASQITRRLGSYYAIRTEMSLEEVLPPELPE